MTFQTTIETFVDFNETSFTCRSFDYERAKSICDFSDTTATSVGGFKTDYPGNPFDHYSREP